MKNATFASFSAMLEEIGHACAGAVRTMVRMPWPGLLACCVALALAITVMPLALFLFIVFMAVKLVTGAMAGDAQGRRE